MSTYYEKAMSRKTGVSVKQLRKETRKALEKKIEIEVTIIISSDDFQEMMKHFAQYPGSKIRPLVAVRMLRLVEGKEMRLTT